MAKKELNLENVGINFDEDAREMEIDESILDYDDSENEGDDEEDEEDDIPELEQEEKPKSKDKPKDKPYDKETEEPKEKPKAKSKGKSDIEVDYKALGELLVEDGILSELPDKEQLEPEDLLEAITKDIGIAKEQWIEETELQLNDMTGGLIAFLKAGNKLEDWTGTNTKGNFKNLDLKKVKEDKVLAEAVLREAYTRRKFNEKKINKMIELAKDTDSLHEDALEEAEFLVETDKEQDKAYVEMRKKEEKQKEAAYKEALQTVKKQVEEIDEPVPGIKLSKDTKKTLYNNIVNRKVMSKIASDLKYETNLAILDHLGLLDLDFKKILPSLSTKATKEVKKQFYKTATTQKSNKGGDKGIDALTAFARKELN